MDTYETINLKDYLQTGEGGTALTYNKKDGKTLAKLFSPGIAAETAAREFHVNRVVYNLGIPTPEPLRLITDGERYGAEYELIPGKRSFTRIISEEPEMLEPLSIRFAAHAKRIHSTKADTSLLPSMKELVRNCILEYSALPEDVRDLALRRLDSLPDATTCLHGDLHIGNIITDGKRDIWIDVGDFAYGCPEWDLGMMCYTCKFLSEQRADSIFHLTKEVLGKHWEYFASAYFNAPDHAALQEIEKELYPYFSLKMLYIIAKIRGKDTAPSEGILAIIRKYLQQ